MFDVCRSWQASGKIVAPFALNSITTMRYGCCLTCLVCIADWRGITAFKHDPTVLETLGLRQASDWSFGDGHSKACAVSVNNNIINTTKSNALQLRTGQVTRFMNAKTHNPP